MERPRIQKVWISSLCLVLFVLVVPGDAQFHYDDVMQFESYNYRQQYVSFTVERGTSGPMEATMAVDAKRFYLRKGIIDLPNTVSFESADFPGWFLMRQEPGRELDLVKNYWDSAFIEGASFYGGHGTWFTGFMTFESVKHTGTYIRHRTSRLYVEEAGQDELSREDSSWRMSKGPFLLQPSSQYNCFPPCQLSESFNGEAIVSDKATPLYVVSPGLDGNHAESVSFHRADSTDVYLRSYEGLVYFEDSKNIIRDPNSYDKDASFALRRNRFIQGYYAIEEITGGRYMCRSELQVMMKLDDNSAYFVDDASFKTLEGPLLLESPDNAGVQIGVDGKKGVMTSPGTRFNIVHPGLSQTAGTVSLESYKDAGEYLRHYFYALELEKPEDGKNPDIFPQDASFFLRIDVFRDKTISLESENYAGYYLCHEDNKLVIKQFEDTTAFKNSAAFTKIEADTDIERNPEVPVSSNKTAIVAASVSVGIIVLLIVVAFFVDRMLNKRKAMEEALAKQNNETTNDGIENPSYDTIGSAPSKREGDECVTIEPLPSVSSLVKEPGPPPITLERRESIGAKLRRSISGGDNEESIPIRNAIQTKLRRLSNSFSRPDKLAVNRRADIPPNFDIDFTKPFDFDAAGGEQAVGGNQGGIGFGNPLFGQQPSRLSLTFDELPSPLDFGTDGFESGGKSSSDTTPQTPQGLFFDDDDDDAAPTAFPPIKKKSSPRNDLYAEIDSTPKTGANFFTDDPVLATSNFPSVRRKSSDKRSSLERKRVSFSDIAEHKGEHDQAVISSHDLEDNMTSTDEPIYAQVDKTKKKKKQPSVDVI